jgi:hypothetical protein
LQHTTILEESNVFPLDGMRVTSSQNIVEVVLVTMYVSIMKADLFNLE